MIKVRNYEYIKKFDNMERLTKYLSKIENLDEAKIIKGHYRGTWLLMFSKY